MLKKICNICKFQQDEFLNEDGRNYCKGCNSEISNKSNTIQDLVTLSAYEKQTVHEIFRNSLEWLEKYIEVVYSDYRIKKQIYDNKIKRQDANDPDKVEGLFVGALFGFKATIEMTDEPKFLYDEVKQEYYKWLGATGIDVKNCPPRLKHFLFEINEILEGRGDKFEKDVKNRKWEIDPNSVEYEEALDKLFFNIQSPLDDARNEYERLKDKTHKDIKVENNFDGDSKSAEKTFKQMAGKHDYQGFNFLPQKDAQTILQEQNSSSFQGRPNSVIVRNIKQNSNDWRVDEVNVHGVAEKLMALVHHSVSDEVIDLDSQPVYLPERFFAQERFEIKKSLKLSSDYFTDEEIKWIIREVKNNPSIWKIRIDKEQIYLVHSLAQGKDKVEFGTLIHSRQKFSKSEWLEIDEVLVNNQYEMALGKIKGEMPLEQQETREELEIWVAGLKKRLLIISIKQNIDKLEVRENEVIVWEKGNKVKEGKVLILKGIKLNNSDYDQQTGELINQSGKVYRQDCFDDQEQAEINEDFISYYENRKIIEFVKSNVKNWKTEKINGNYWLVNNQAQKVQGEVGHLLHPKQRFTSEEWTEIENALNNQSLVSQVVSKVSGVFPNFGNKQNYSLGVGTVFSSQLQKGNNSISAVKVLGIVGIIGVLVITSVLVLRKKLNKKTKR